MINHPTEVIAKLAAKLYGKPNADTAQAAVKLAVEIVELAKQEHRPAYEISAHKPGRGRYSAQPLETR